MFRWCKKDDGGTCFPALEKLLGRRGVRVELSGGLLFIDEVIRLEGPEAAPVAVFASRTVPVASIVSVELAADPG